MPTFRVNTRVSEQWIRQYEIIADDESKAAQLVPILLEMGQRLEITGEEKVGETFGDPSTFTVMDAAPLEAMEMAEAENQRLLKERHRGISSIETALEATDVVPFPMYENNGGIVSVTKSKKKGH